MQQKLSLISATINAIGILLGVIGSYLIWRHGIPPADIEGPYFACEDDNPEKREKNRSEHGGKSRCGMMCLIISFALQLASAILSIIALK